MASSNWNGGAGGWGTIANWSGGIPNSSTADATIATGGTYTVTLEAGKSYTVDSATLANNTATLNVLGSLILGGTLATFLDDAGTVELGGVISGGTVDIENSSTLLANGGALTGNKNFDLGGSANLDLASHNLTLAGTSTLEGYVFGSGSLVISGVATLSDNTFFEAGTTLDDTGTIILQTSNQLGSGGTAATGLTIAAGGIYDVTGANIALNDNGTVNIANAGLLEMTATSGSYINVYYTSFANTGTISVAAGDDITLLGSNAALAGHLAGAGELFLDGGTTTLQAGLTSGIGTLALNNGDTLLLGAGFTLANEFDASTSSYLNLNSHNLTLAGTGTARGYVYGGGTLVIAGSIDTGGLYLASGNEELVTGTAIFDSYSERLDYDGGTAASILSIAGSGTFDITAINSDIDYNTTLGSILNAGLFENIEQTPTFTANGNDDSYLNIYANFTNAATGTIYLGTADDISLLYGQDTLAGTITGPGDIYLGQHATVALAAGLVLNNGRYLTISDGNTDVILESNRAFTPTYFDLVNGAALNLNGYNATVANGGTLAGYVNGPGTLDVTGTVDNNGLYLSSGVTEIISGAEYQTNETRLDYDGGTVATVISITSTGTYDIISDSTIDDYSGYDNYGTIIVAGLFEKTGYSSYSNIYAAFSLASTGTLSIGKGLDVSLLNNTTNDLAGTITGGGDLYIGGNGGPTMLEASAVIGPLAAFTVSDSNTQLILENSRTIAAGTTFTDQNGADVLLNGNTLTLAGPSQFTNAYVSGNGGLIIAGTADIDGLNVIGTATVIDAGVITQDGYDELGTTNSAQVTLSITTHGTYDLINDSYINPQNGGPIVNAGLFEKTAAAGLSDVYSVFTNTSTGTIDAASGTIRLDNSGVIAGSLAGAGTLALNGGTVALAVGAIGVANFAVYGTDLVLQENVTDAHQFTQNGGLLALNGFNLALGNPGDDLSNGYLTGLGTVSETARLDLNNYYLSGGAVLKDAGTFTQDGGLTLGTFGADVAQLSITSAGIYDILNDSAIGTDGATLAVINNAGLFEKTAATGGSNIYATFNNAAGATLAVANGYIQLNGGGALAGTLSGAGTLYLNQYYAAQTYTLASTAVVSVATLDLNGATLDLTASRVFTDSFLQTGGALALGGFNATLANAASLDNADLSGPGTLDLAAATELRNYYVTGGATLLDAATVNADGPLQLGNAAADSGTLGIGAGGVYNFTNDSNINTTGTGVVSNAGLLEKSTDNGQSIIYAGVNNSGTIAVVRGTLDLAGGGTLGGTLTGAGTLALGGGGFVLQSAAVVGVATLEDYNAAVTLAGNRVLTDNFLQYYGGATIALAGHTLTLAGHSSLAGNATAAGAGTLAITGSADLNGYNLTGGVVLADTGTITQDGAVQIGVNSADSATLSIASGAIYDILNDNYIYQSGAAALVNAGLFEKTGSGTGRTYLQGGVTNASTGTIALTTGTLEIQTLINGGLVTVSNALLVSDNGVTGAGRIALGGNAILAEASGIAATQTVALSGTNNLIEIGNNTGFAGTIAGFTAGDTIDLQNTVANGYAYGGNKLTLTENGTILTTLALSGITTPGSLSLVQDGNGGTNIEFSRPGSITQPTGAITTNTFTAGSGNFNTAANWGNGTIANAGNTAVDHGAGTIADSGVNTVYGLDFNNTGLVFDQTAGTLTVIDGGQITSGALNQSAAATLIDQAGTLSLPESGTLAGTLAGSGEIEIGGNPGSGQTVTLAAGAVLSVATLALYNAVLGGNETYAGVFAGPGGDYLGLNGNTLNLTGQAFFAPTYEYSVSGPGALIVAGSAAAGNLNLNGGATLDLTGTMTADQALSFNGGNGDAASATIAATGTFAMTNGGNIYGDGNGATTLVNAGLLERSGDYGTATIQYVNITQTGAGELSAGVGALQLYADAGTLAGTLAGNFINLNGDAITLAAGAVLSVATLQINGGNTITLGGGQTYAGNFDMSGGAGGALALGGYNLALTGAAELGGEYVAGTGTLTVAGTADINGMVLVGGETLLDNGTITQDGAYQLGQYATDTTSMTIAAGAVYNLINDSNVDEAGAASITNAGLFEKTAVFGDSNVYAAFTNASTGTLDVASGRLLLANGGSLNGTIEGAGTLYLQNYGAPDTTTLAGSAIVTIATLNVNDTLVLENNRTLTGTLIDSNAIDLNGFNLALTGSAALDGYLQGPGTVTVNQADINGLYLYGAAALVDRGTVTQDGGFTMSNTGTDNTALTIASGAVYDLLTDNAINANGPATITNAGLFEKTGDYGNSNLYPVFNSTGTLDVARGFLVFQSGGSLSGTIEGGKDGSIADGGIIENGGTLTLGATATLAVAEINVANGDLSFAASETYAGSLVGTGGSLSLNGHTLGVTSPYLGGFYLTGPGTLAVSGTATLSGLGEISGAVLIDKGTIIDDGGYQIGYSGTDASELSIASGATFDLITDNYITANGTVGVINAGLFEKTADNGYSGIQSAFTNQSTGTLAVTFGTLAIQGGGVLGGTIKGAGELQLDSAATLTSSVVTVATLDVASYATLGVNLTYGGFFDLNYGESLTLASHSLVLSGTADLIGAFQGPGSVTVSGSANVQLADLYGGSTLVDSGFISQTDELRFSLNDQTTDELSITSTGTYDILDDSNFHDYANAGTAELAINAGLLEKTGDAGLSELEVTLTNTGTLLVSSGTLQVDAISNLSGGTLAGGTYVVDAGLNGPTLALAGAPIVVDAASVTLSGAGADLTAGGTLVETSLATVAAGGTLAIEGSRGFTAANALADAGKILLQGGTFAAPSLSIASAGTFAGYGTLAGPVTDNGLINVSGGTLTVANSVTGTGNLSIGTGNELILGSGAASGTDITFGASQAVLGLVAPGSVQSTLVSLIPSDTIDLIGIAAKSATITGGDLVITLTAGGTLSYALANAGTLDREAVVSDGAGGTDIVTYRQATAGTIHPASVNFGQHHAGVSLTQTYTIANTTSVDPYSENLDGQMDGTTGGVTDSGSFTGLAPGATNSTSLMATLVTTTGGVISGTATVNLQTDGNGVGGDSGTMSLPSETVTLTGTIFNYATASAAAPNPINFGQHHVGAALSQTLVLANTAAPGAYSENLDAKFSGTSANLSANGSINLLKAGSSNASALSIGLKSGAAGVQTGATTLALTSDGKNIDSLGATALPGQTITATGTLFNYATASTAAPNPIAFGQAHVGAALSQTLTLANTAAAGIYSENLDAKFSGTSANLTASGTISELAAGATNGSGLTLKLNSGSAGAFTGTSTIGLTSDGRGIDTLSSTGLAGQKVTVTGTLFNFATASLTPQPVAFGQHHVGDSLSQMITIANAAAPGAYSENLNISLSGTSAYLAGSSGSISELAAGATNSTAVDLVLSSGAAGIHNGTATFAAVSDGSTIDTLGTTTLGSPTITVTSTLFNYATASTARPSPLNFGIVHVGQTIGHFIAISNVASAGSYSENLNASLSGTSSGFTAAGAVSELAAGKTSGNGLQISIATGAAGTFSGTTTLGLTSDGQGIDTLGTTVLGNQTIALTGTVNNYATATVETLSGPGTLSGSGTSYNLNLGSVAKGSAAVVEKLGILNSASGPADNLSGTFFVTGATQIGHTGFSSFSGVGAGQADTAPKLTLSTGSVGTFTETIYIVGTGSNASGYSGALAHETLTVTGTVTAAPALATQVPAAQIATAQPAMAFLAPAAAHAAAPLAGQAAAAPLTGQAAGALTPHPTADIFSPAASSWEKLFDARLDALFTGQSPTLAASYLPANDGSALKHLLAPAPHP